MWPFKRKEKTRPKSLEPKDPNDHSLTDSSTAWWLEPYCDKCFRIERNFSVRDSGFCSHCGRYEQYWTIRPDRVVRKFWNGERWMYQYRYVSGLHEREQIREQPWA